LPVVFSMVYEAKALWRFQPYLGLGLTSVFTFNGEVTNEVLREDGNPRLEIEPAFAPLLQLGLNTRLYRKLMLVTDVKFGKGLKSKASINDITLVSPTFGDIVGPTSIGSASVDAEVDATVFSVGLRYDF